MASSVRMTSRHVSAAVAVRSRPYNDRYDVHGIAMDPTWIHLGLFAALVDGIPDDG